MDLCICGVPVDTKLALWCQECRDDERRRFAATAARKELIALRAEVVKVTQERDEAVRRAERAEARARTWRTNFYARQAPHLHLIGGH